MSNEDNVETQEMDCLDERTEAITNFLADNVSILDLVAVQNNLHYVSGYFEGSEDQNVATFLDLPIEVIDQLIRKELRNA